MSAMVRVVVMVVAVWMSQLSSGFAADAPAAFHSQRREQQPTAVLGVRSATLHNLALGKPAEQSSFHPKYHQPPGLAVDGNHNTHYKNCSHTNKVEPSLWWMVDLQAKFEVFSVRITNRGDCCGDRLKNFEVQVLQNNPQVIKDAHNYTCYNQTQSMMNGATEEFVCAQPIRGRYVRIAMPNDEPKKRPLHLCEVEVWGKAASPDAVTSTRYVHSDGQRAGGQVLLTVSPAPSAAQCLDWCNTEVSCNAVNVGQHTLTSSGWTGQCQLLSFGGIGQPNTTSDQPGWDFYRVDDPE